MSNVIRWPRTTQQVQRQVQGRYHGGSKRPASPTLNNIPAQAVPLMGKGQTRLWGSLFTAGCLAAVRSRSGSTSSRGREKTKASRRRLILRFWMLWRLSTAREGGKDSGTLLAAALVAVCPEKCYRGTRGDSTRFASTRRNEVPRPLWTPRFQVEVCDVWSFNMA